MPECTFPAVSAGAPEIPLEMTFCARAAPSRFKKLRRVLGLMPSNAAARSSGTRATAQSMARAICSDDGFQRISGPQQSGACQEPRAWLGSKVVAAPSGALAADFIASVSAGNPCGTAVLERSAIDARAQIAAVETDIRVWEQTWRECELATRAKEADIATAKEHVERCARIVLANSAMVTRLVDDLETKQAEIIEKRVILRFIWGKGLNGELSGPYKDRMERLLRQDLTGLESHPVRGVWQAAFDKLLEDPEAELPFAGAV
jgi:hypothetical protein